MKPEIKVGQEWTKANNNRKGATRIRVLEGPCFQQVVVGTVTKDGRVIRRRNLLASALSNTPSGYRLAKDAQPEATSEHTTAPCRDCGVSGGRHYAACEFYASTQPAQPSALERVRKAVQIALGRAKEEDLASMLVDADSALATLEESIRADERARVGDELQRRGYPVAGCAVLAMKR